MDKLIDKNDPDLTIHSALGFDQLLAGRSSTSAAVPKVNNSRTPAKVEEDKPVKSSAKPAQDYCEDERKSEKDSFLGYALLTFLSNQETDEKGEFASSNLTDFVHTLEKMGFNVEPIKKVIEDVSGKPYAEFEASSGTTGSRISASELYESARSGPGRIIPDGQIDARIGIAKSRSDNAGEGLCARGTKNVLRAMGIKGVPEGIGSATNWDEALRRDPKHWREVTYDPNNVKEGTVVIVQSDAQSGKGVNNNGRGAQHGHISVMLENPNKPGQMLSVSDTVRSTIWGSVKGNRVVAFEPILDSGPAVAHNPRGPSLGLG